MIQGSDTPVGFHPAVLAGLVKYHALPFCFLLIAHRGRILTDASIPFNHPVVGSWPGPLAVSVSSFDGLHGKMALDGIYLAQVH